MELSPARQDAFFDACILNSKFSEVFFDLSMCLYLPCQRRQVVYTIKNRVNTHNIVNIPLHSNSSCCPALFSKPLPACLSVLHFCSFAAPLQTDDSMICCSNCQTVHKDFAFFPR